MKKALFSVLLVCVAALVPGSLTGKAQAAASDGKEKIAFVSDRDGNNEIYITNADGTGAATRLTNNAAEDINPCISPDGNKISWASNRSGANHDLYEANIDGSNPVRLTTTGDNLQPTYSPDGQKIAFPSNRAGSLYDIWIVDRNGSNPLKLTAGSYSSYHPSFSPDGQQIAFNTTYKYQFNGGLDGPTHHLYSEITKINVDGSGLQKLTSRGSSNINSVNATWNALNTIAFTSGNKIYTMDADGANQKNISNNTATDDDATWSPSAQKIAFTSNRDGNSEIYIMNGDASGTPVRLTNNTASDSAPSWGPPTNAPLPHFLLVSDVSVAEGDSGTTNAIFTVTLYAAQTIPVTVDYMTSGGTATPGVDYTPISEKKTLIFQAGETTKTVSVPIIGDILNEDNETFNLALSNPVNATIVKTQGVATITNDDPLPAISVDNQSKIEGNSGTAVMTFHATLSTPSGRTVTVKYSTVDITTNADDYAPASGTLTFAPGTVSQNIPISIKGDIKPEADEAFSIALSEPTNAVVPLAFNPSNQHYYKLVAADVNWVTAKAAAEAKTLGGVKGHLVTITSAAEQQFLNAYFSAHAYFTGGVQTPGSAEVNKSFSWITGEPFSYTNWNTGEPNGNNNNKGVIHAYGADYGTAAIGKWNDVPDSYIGKEKYAYPIYYVIEYDTTAPVAIAGGIGTILNDDGPVPPQPWNAADLAVGSDNLARLLWQRPDHAFALWTLSASNAINSTPLLGPINGWNAPAIGVDSDGKIRALLNNINGASAAWTVQNPSTGNITSTPAYGPYSGFNCREIAAAPDNTTRLLWVRSDGAFAVWTVDGGGSFTSTPLFGPVAGWSANAIGVGGDNKTTILLNSTDGKAAVWTVQNTTTGNITSTPAYGPINGFSCRDIATGSDNKTRMLWVKSDGAFAVWTATASNAANNYTSTPLYGPIAGWAGIKLGVGGDLKTRVLLTHTDGRAAVWTIESNGQFTSTPAYGPIAYQPASRALVQAATGDAP